MQKKKPPKPRGEYRSRWDMPHQPRTIYDRRRAKEEVKELLEELEEDESEAK